MNTFLKVLNKNYLKFYSYVYTHQKTMAKSKKTTTESTTAPKTASKKATPVTTPEPVAVAEPVPEPVPVQEVAAKPSVEVVVETLDDTFKSLGDGLVAMRTNLKSLEAEVKKLRKRVTTEMNEARKNQRRKKTRNDDPNRPKRPPSGFAKPSKLSSDLCKFLGRPEGSELARTEVTKEITKYIREENLQDPTYKRRILCDKKLGDLLLIKDGDEVTYFNLQSFMKPHFPKPLHVLNAIAAAEAATASATT